MEKLNKRPLRTNMTIGQTSEVAHTLSFHPRGRNWAYFRSMGSGSRDFQNCHIWAWNVPNGESSRSCTYAHLLPQAERNWAYFHSTGSGIRDTGPFSNCHIWSWNLAIGQVPKMYIYYLNYPTIPKFHSVLLYGWPFPRYCIFPLGTMLNFNLFFKV